MTNSKKWIPIEKFLPKEFGFDCNKDVQKLISYIVKEKEAFDYETDDINKHLVLKILPVGDIGMVVQNFEVQKFLVFLLRKGVISKLYLPIYVKRVNQKVVQTRQNLTFYLGEDVALSESINKPKKFQKQIIKFEIVNWDAFLKIKQFFKVEKKWEEFEKEAEEEREKFAIPFQLQEKNFLQEEIAKRAEEAEKNKKLEEGIIAKIKNNTDKELPQVKNHPHCIVEGRWGFLKFGKFGEKIKIGKQTSRPFRLLQCLLEPLGTAKTIDAVYDAIRLPKDKNDQDLSGYDGYQKKNKQISIIQNSAIKELQKGNKLQGKLDIKFDDTKSKIWIELVG